MFVAFIKDNIAVAISRCNSKDELGDFAKIYDDIIEITQSEYENFPLPAKLENGSWVKTDKTPRVDYPDPEVLEPKDVSVYDELAAAYKEGVQEA